MTRASIVALVLLACPFSADAQAPSARDALRAFKALHSALDLGLNYRDYSQRLIDTKIRFDEYAERKSATVTDAKIKSALSSAMNHHRLAQAAWSAQTQLRGDVPLSTFDTVKELPPCSRLGPLLADIKRNYDHVAAPDRKTVPVGEPWSEQLLPALWSCAAVQLAEAEKLLGAAK